MSNLNDLELVTCIDLSYQQSDKAKPVYQFAYSSELYGTMFAIYAKFEGHEVEDGKAFELDMMILKLVNYKGYINLGFTEHGVECVKMNGGANVHYDMSFGVRGASTLVDKIFNFKEKGLVIRVEKGVRLLFIFKRTLYPLIEFEKFLAERAPNSNAGSLLKGEPPLTGLFDTEFNDRDGVDLYNRDLKPGMCQYTPPSEAIEAVGHRCNTSSVNLSF